MPKLNDPPLDVNMPEVPDDKNRLIPTETKLDQGIAVRTKKTTLTGLPGSKKGKIRFWVMSKLRSIADRFFPSGTLRRQIVSKIVAVIRTLIVEGPRALFYKVLRFFRPGRYGANLTASNLSVAGDTSVLVDQVWEKRTPTLSMFTSADAPIFVLPEDIRERALQTLQGHPVTISVIIATWNRSYTICETIQSALRQSYSPAEVIVSDDGSTDNTLNIIRNTFPAELASGRLILLENLHEGVSHTRNRALEISTGNIITYLDSDNIWQDDYLLILAAVYSENDEVCTAYAGLHSINLNEGIEKILFEKYDRGVLLTRNFIDLNVFSHRRSVLQQQGMFDPSLTRLVDWELIIRYTRHSPPARIPYIGGVYRLDKDGLKNITFTQPLASNLKYVYDKHISERLELGLVPLKLGYVIWDFPSLSQTFVMNELRWLIKSGYDVNVYYRVMPDQKYPLDFSVNAYPVSGAEHLAELLVQHERNYCHSHFVYPAVTLLTFPACKKTGIPFTFMPHAVDLFHKDNLQRNLVGEISSHVLCKKVFVYGEYHKKFLVDKGVPPSKVAFAFQAVDISGSGEAVNVEQKDEKYSGIVIARFIEKKGIKYLLQAAKLLENLPVSFDIYGFGPLKESYEEQIRDLDLKNLRLHGELNGEEELNYAYERADFLVVPSVIAENGDMDGFPTVILEAMARGLPVITTNVSAIPDYVINSINALLIVPADSQELANAVIKLMNMPVNERAAMVSRAKFLIQTKIGIDKTMQMLLDVWLNRTVDIVLVTYNTKEYDSKNETMEIINRVLKNTSSPYNLLIVDNNSDVDFVDDIQKMIAGLENVSLLRKQRNVYLGPATNTAMRLGRSKYAIYLCSKEGFIKTYGWERSLLHFIQQSDEVVLAGYKSYLPKYVRGSDLTNHPDFSKFRNQEFARENPSRIFKHIQGGVFILDREKFLQEGGFNDNIPQANMDVELSYYLESKGYKLASIPSVVSITTKTRPVIRSLIDENTVVAHPLTIDNVNQELDGFGADGMFRCNICGWMGGRFDEVDGSDSICPDCQSTGFGRAVFRLLASDHHAHRGMKLVALCSDSSLIQEAKYMFASVSQYSSLTEFEKYLQNNPGQLHCVIIDARLLQRYSVKSMFSLIASALTGDGLLIFSDDFSEDYSMMQLNDHNGYRVFDGDIEGVRFSAEVFDYQSYWLQLGAVRLWKLIKQ